MAPRELKVDVGVRVYGGRLARLVGRVCRGLGASPETSFVVATSCLLFRFTANGKTTWRWGGA